MRIFGSTSASPSAMPTAVQIIFPYRVGCAYAALPSASQCYRVNGRSNFSRVQKPVVNMLWTLGMWGSKVTLRVTPGVRRVGIGRPDSSHFYATNIA